jgi:glycosyltransferase involved in cell wall biosynthesis
MHASELNDPERRRRRILWLIKGLGPGGAENLLVSLASVARHDRFDYRVAYIRGDKQHLAPTLESLGVRTKWLGASSRRWPVELSRLIRNSSIDVVHAHSPLMASLARIAVHSLPRDRRPLMVYTEHNQWASFTAPTRILNALTLALNDKTWAVSEDVRQSMWPRRRRQTSVLVHGIVAGERPADSVTGARLRIRAELGIDDSPILVGTVANFRSQKDYPNLIAAVELARGLEPALRFVVVGQGPLEADIRAQVDDLGLNDVITILGYRRDVTDILAACDLFALASRHEGLPVALMEALAAGLPVVATSVGGIPEAIQDGRQGYVVPPQRPDLLADSLVALARDPQKRAQMRTESLQRASTYDISNAAAVLECAYEEGG